MGGHYHPKAFASTCSYVPCDTLYKALVETHGENLVTIGIARVLLIAFRLKTNPALLSRRMLYRYGIQVYASIRPYLYLAFNVR